MQTFAKCLHQPLIRAELALQVAVVPHRCERRRETHCRIGIMQCLGYRQLNLRL